MKLSSRLSSAGRMGLAVLRNALLLLAALWLITTFNLLGLMLCIFLMLFYGHLFAERRRNYSKNFNSALRTTIQINGHIKGTAEAFSKSGPLRRKCEKFAGRLTAGEEPLAAAVTSALPLELETAIALSLPDAKPQSESKPASANEVARRNTNRLSIASQLFYLIIICCVLILASIFHETFIEPTLRSHLTEMQPKNDNPAQIWAVPLLSITALVVASSAIGFYLVAILGLIPQILAFRWVPLLPVAAARKAAILTGIATTIENRFSLKGLCEIGAQIYHGRTRRQFLKALREIDSGYADPDVLCRADWISAADQAWLQEATPTRQAEILRNISRQNIRHADANLNWIMAIAFPAAILCLATAATPFAISFFSRLSSLVTDYL